MAPQVITALEKHSQNILNTKTEDLISEALVIEENKIKNKKIGDFNG